MTVGTMVEGSGERKLRENRKRFWRMVGWGLGLGFGIGAATGVLTGFIETHQDKGGASIGWLIWPVLAGAAVFFIRYSVLYFRRVDEVDLQDNLWSSLVGLYAFFCVMPMWALLHHLGQTPRPDAWALWVGTSAVAFGAYGWRKLRNRF